MSPRPAAIRIEPDWHEVLEVVRRAADGARVGVVGRTGSGKSTLASWLSRSLSETASTAILDADPGQGRIGPPGTIGLGFESGRGTSLRALWFVGATSPARHLLDMAAGLVRLARRADRSGVRFMVVDPPGFLDFPAGHAFHLRLIEVLELDHLVALDATALEPVLASLRRRRRPAVHELRPSPAVVERSRAARREWRVARFRAALAGARSRTVPPEIPVHGHLPDRDQEWSGRLVGLLDRDGFLLRLGVAEGPTAHGLKVCVPALDLDEVSAVAVGTGRVDPLSPCRTIDSRKRRSSDSSAPGPSGTPYRS